MALASGTKLGPYEITAPLGAGGMGEVYRARDNRLGRDVAIKVLPPGFSQDGDRLRRFEQEARAAGILNHPNILSIYDIGTIAGAPYLVSELLEGQTLRETLRAMPLSPYKAIEVGIQIAHGLGAAHEKGIVHRDLKPENLFVTKDGRVKILDFGLAKLKPAPAGINTDVSTRLPGTAPGVVMGTVGYMSPEQVRAEEVDHRSDIFAFGAILYEMLAGRRAFEGDSAVEVLNAILKEEPPEISEPKREVPPALVRVIRHCLEKSREDRFQSIADVAFYLEALPAAADRETSAAERARPRGRGRRWMAVTAAGIALAAAITIWQVRWSDEVWENPLANAHIERVTDFPGIETSAAISADGKFIVFVSDRDGPLDVWLNQVGSGALVNLTKGRFSQPQDKRNIGIPADSPAVGFSADASHVWLRLNRIPEPGGIFEPWGIFLMPTVGGAPRPFIERAVHAAWSPDGQRVAYHGGTPGDPTFISDRYGSNPRQIFIEKLGIHCHHHVWSPDGRYLYMMMAVYPQLLDKDLSRVTTIAIANE